MRFIVVLLLVAGIPLAQAQGQQLSGAKQLVCEFSTQALYRPGEAPVLGPHNLSFIVVDLNAGQPRQILQTEVNGQKYATTSDLTVTRSDGLLTLSEYENGYVNMTSVFVESAGAWGGGPFHAIHSSHQNISLGGSAQRFQAGAQYYGRCTAT